MTVRCEGYAWCEVHESDWSDTDGICERAIAPVEVLARSWSRDAVLACLGLGVILAIAAYVGVHRP